MSIKITRLKMWASEQSIEPTFRLLVLPTFLDPRDGRVTTVKGFLVAPQLAANGRTEYLRCSLAGGEIFDSYACRLMTEHGEVTPLLACWMQDGGKPAQTSSQRLFSRSSIKEARSLNLLYFWRDKVPTGFVLWIPYKAVSG